MSEAQFKKAVEIIRNMPKDGPVQPSQNEQLTFYGLYKQATEGDVSTSRPGMMDFAGRYKWDAWNSRKGMSKEDAMAKYVEEFKNVLGKSDEEEAKELISQVDNA